MNNTITMTDIEVSLQSILALMQLTQEGLESDIHTAVNAKSNDAACILASISGRLQSIYIPAYDAIFSAIGDLRSKIMEVSQ